MKWQFKTAMLAMFLFTALQTSFAQTAKDIFDESKPITYLGVDFSEVKIANLSDYEIEELTSRYFRAINELVLNEPKRYNLPDIFHRSDIPTDISLVEAKNKGLDVKKVKSSNEEEETHFTANTIESIVKGYNFGKKGTGVLFVVETLNKGIKDTKNKPRGVIHVVFVDMGSKKVLLTERFRYEPSGFGPRNYWASIVKKAFDEIENSKYKSWKKANP